MKKNITMAIDEHLLKRARKAASAKNKSLNALIRNYLQQLATTEENNKNKAIKELGTLLNSSKAIVGEKTWRRDELYER